MDATRRTYLRALVPSGLSFTVAGCLSNVGVELADSSDDDDQERTSQSHAFGEVVEYRGVKVAPTAWTTTDEITYHLNSDKHTSSPTGSTFLLTHVEANFVGAASGCCPGAGKRLLPARESATTGAEDISVAVDGEEATPGRYEATAVEIEIRENRLIPYEAARQTANANEPVHPGIGFAGWTVTEVSDRFEPESTTIEIRWGAADATGGDKIESFDWRFDDSRLSIDEAAAQNDTR